MKHGYVCDELQMDATMRFSPAVGADEIDLRNRLNPEN
jgi:hypothetical protein